MITYREFRPSGFDCAGLGLEDRQDWLVAPVSVNRDSDCLTRSNWEVVTKNLESESVNSDETEIHDFGHWACGWFRICLVKPDSRAAMVAQEWEDALADYPVADENHFSDLEFAETLEYWRTLSIKERVQYIQECGGNIFSARKDIPPPEVFDRLRDS